MAEWDRFDICEAHCVLEWDYNRGGWLPERPSNRRRMESTGVQINRIGFRPAPVLDYDTLSPNGQEIYHELVARYGLPVPEEG